MSRTIVQEYGPIYGEPVNGTVMGRPNGSVYVPLSNTIEIELADDYKYIMYWPGIPTSVVFCDSSGAVNWSGGGPTVIATAQDLSSNMQLQIYTDGALTTLAAVRDLTAGNFNLIVMSLNEAIAGLSDGDTLYLRAQLMNNTTPVATSNVVEITMVVP